MTTHYITVEIVGSVWVIKINLPKTGNKLTIACMEELATAFREADVSPDCKAIVLGAWGDDFCTGGALGNFRKKSSMEIRRFSTAFIALHSTIQSISKPVVAAICGAVEGGGFTLVEVCDLAVAAEDAHFAIPEILDGLAPMMSLTGAERMLPRKKVMELALLGRSLSALEAKNLGLVNSICEKDEVLGKAIAIAKELSNKNPTSIYLCKALYHDLISDTYVSNLEKAALMLVTLLKSEDAQEVLDARDDGRLPVWKHN